MAMTTMEHILSFEDATPLLSQPETLRAQAKKTGYLFFKGLLPETPLLALRRQIMKICQRHGWLAAHTQPMDGIAKPDFAIIESQDPRWQAFYCEVLKLPNFHALALHPAMLGALETLFGEAPLAHSRNICRLIFPDSAHYSTPPHQDHFYIGGSQETWTAWIPCGDCPAELGSLAMAVGSHTWGMQSTHKAEGAGGNAVEIPPDTVWANGNFKGGDALFIHSLAVHQGRDNLSGDRLRLSCDFRYQPLSHPVRSDSLLPHMGWLDWQEVYRDWPADEPLKYYWNNLNLKIVERPT
jgi:ectoine hydroxylase-related dioxygenase (phytanoyl-CoA dioxygenase family)